MISFGWNDHSIISNFSLINFNSTINLSIFYQVCVKKIYFNEFFKFVYFLYITICCLILLLTRLTLVIYIFLHEK